MHKNQAHWQQVTVIHYGTINQSHAPELTCVG